MCESHPTLMYIGIVHVSQPFFLGSHRQKVQEAGLGSACEMIQ
jgi:hypothetical protein